MNYESRVMSYTLRIMNSKFMNYELQTMNYDF